MKLIYPDKVGETRNLNHNHPSHFACKSTKFIPLEQEKRTRNEKKAQIICTYQKKAVPLRSLLGKDKDALHKDSKPFIILKKREVAIATVAQLVEQRIRNAWVGGSSPPSGSKHRIKFGK